MIKLVLLFMFTSSLFAQTKVLLSYFKPFGTYQNNHSKQVALEIYRNTYLKKHNIKIILCPSDSEGLDVSFHSDRNDLMINGEKIGSLQGSETSFTQLKQCLTKHPDIKDVFSLGEGGCQISFETIAHNDMKESNPKKADHNGNLVLRFSKIENNEIKSRKIQRQKNLETFCYLKSIDPDFKKGVNLSTNAGSYICNNLSYNFVKYLSEKKKNINFEFIHIPPMASTMDKRCTNEDVNRALKNRVENVDKVYSKYIARKIAKFIKTKNDLNNDRLPKKTKQNRNCEELENKRYQKKLDLDKEINDIINLQSY